MILSKEKPISTSLDCILENDEGRTITLEFSKFYIVNTYVPNSGQKLERLAYRTEKWYAFLNMIH